MDQELRELEKADHDLSDIVLEKKSKKAAGTKKWLLTIASAIVLFLIILLVMKMLKQAEATPDEDKIANIGDSVETITDTNSTQEDTTGENLFKKEPIIEESSDTDEKFEEMVKKLKEQELISENLQSKPEQTSKTEEENSSNIRVIKPKEIKTITQEPEEIPVITTPVQHIQPKPIEHKTVKIHQSRPVHINKPKVKKSVADTFKHVSKPSIKGYFIQVGATSRAFPDKRFLSKIKNNGFDYIVHTVYVKGRRIKKVLVGPYNSRTEAMRDLGRVKNSINPSAFVYRLR